MIVEEPYFMKNKDWYYFDEEQWCYQLTDKATEKAKASYKEFYSFAYTSGNDKALLKTK